MQNLAANVIRNLYPLNQLPPDALNELRPAMRERWVARGAQLFDFGENPEEYVYVLEGSVWLTDKKEESFQSVSGSNDSERIPLPYVLPSIHRAKATSEVKVLLVDRRMLAQILSRHTLGVSHATEMSHRAGMAAVEADSWQLALLRAPGFKRVPSDNMRRALQLMQPVPVRAGEMVIQQGSRADSFYVVAEGEAEVLCSFVEGREVRIATCGVGDTFGEDALVSCQSRNASVRMLTDGRLMKLEGDAFRYLIKSALFRSVNLNQATELIARGARWMDVRLPSEREGRHLAGALTIPHPVARSMPFHGDAQRIYVVACSKGIDAPAIAFALCKAGYEAYCLKSGLAGWSEPSAYSSPLAA